MNNIKEFNETNNFIESESFRCDKQIVVIGGGHDVIGLYASNTNENVTIYEIDFPDIIEQKKCLLNALKSTNKNLKYNT